MDDQTSDNSLLSGSETEVVHQRMTGFNSVSSDEPLLACSYEYTHYEQRNNDDNDSEMTFGDNRSQSTESEVSYDVVHALDNRLYTDSLSSTDSTKPLLGQFVIDGIEQNENSNKNKNDDVFHLDITDWELDITESRGRSDTISKMLGSLAFIDALNEPPPDHRLITRVCQKGSTTLSKNYKRKVSVGLLPKKEITDVHFEENANNSIDNHMRNLLVMSFGITLMFISLGSLRNLQSSLNHEEGIGLYSLAAAYAAYMIGSLFTPFVVKQFQPKSCLVASLIPQLIYTVSNAYPALYVFIPASALQGFGNALLWNSMSTYITYLAKASATAKKEKLEYEISKSFGIFFLIFQWSNVLGNLISSLVFRYGGSDYPADPSLNNTRVLYDNISFISNDLSVIDTLNMTSYHTETEEATMKISHFHMCGSKYCHSYTIDHAGMKVDDQTKYILIGVYSAFAVISIVLVASFLEPLRLYRTTAMKCKEIGGQFVSVTKFMCQTKFLLILLLCVYSTMQNAFVTSEVTKAYITCPLGIYMVGYTMICFGLCGAVGSYLSGWLTKHTGRISVICTASVLNVGLLMFMVWWEPSQGQLWPYFLLLGAWGFGDGVWIAQSNSIMSTLFPTNYEEAFAALRIMQGLSFTISYSYAKHLCMLDKIYIVGAVCISGCVLYVIMEILQERESNSDKNEYKQTCV